MPLENSGIIDPHLHLFDLQQGNYAWLKASQAPFWPDKNKIARNFSEHDLVLPNDMYLQGFVHIEAGFDNQCPWREIDWLETQCRVPFKSVACAELGSDNFADVIQQLSQRSSVVGIRHILDDNADEILNHPLIDYHFAALERLAWSFDAQLNLRNIRGAEALLKLSHRFPAVAIIINHAGLPPALAQSNQHQIWADNLQKLSEQANVAIKMSGWEMTNRQWTRHFMLESMALCLRLFGNDRVMLASNFPLCTFSHSYADLWQIYQTELVLPASTWRQLSADNASRWYQFN
ncbi:amidohydrolase family protein [Paraglaciecola sp.]|uniref:amidohydrolase family protein n=1 Tax=Paraglaciecola sp. TaxID=1920173 RepID=UPI0030F3F5E7